MGGKLTPVEGSGWGGKGCENAEFSLFLSFSLMRTRRHARAHTHHKHTRTTHTTHTHARARTRTHTHTHSHSHTHTHTHTQTETKCRQLVHTRPVQHVHGGRRILNKFYSLGLEISQPCVLVEGGHVVVNIAFCKQTHHPLSDRPAIGHPAYLHSGLPHTSTLGSPTPPLWAPTT